VTYVFRLTGAPQELDVRRRDAGAEAWTALPVKTRADIYNGAACLRFGRRRPQTVYVSCGFGGAPRFELEFRGATAEFVSTAKYYDGRRVAYTLSNDNWGCNSWAHPGAPWRGETADESDNYQAALHVCRGLHLPLSIAMNTRSAGGDAWWRTVQQELPAEGAGWEPAVHGQTHPNNAAAYEVRGYRAEILGCRDEILAHLSRVPYGPHVYEHILTFGYCDPTILRIDAGEFLFLRGFNWLDNPTSRDYAPWDETRGLYGVGGLNTKGYDSVLERREPKGRYFAADVAELDQAFDALHRAGGVFYALWHPDRFHNSVVYDPRPGVDGVQGSTLIQHLKHVAHRNDVWYVANGWLYSYRYVAQHARVTALEAN
jgi:peptidoglycan/xylan/chitin deacetylase (PgdA/CDA1 family)